jgi:small-conductance mechanosensitive channel
MLTRNYRNIIAAACLAMTAASAFGQAPPKAGAAPEGSVVTLGERTLFVVRTGVGPFSARDRAAAINARLRSVAADLEVPISAITAAPSDTSTDIVEHDLVLMTVTDADAQAAGTTRDQLSAAYVAAIRAAVEAKRAEYSVQSLLVGAGEALAATLLLVLLIGIIRRTFRTFRDKIEASRASMHSIRVQRAEVLSAERITNILVRGVITVRVLLVLLLVYVYVPLVLSFFPWTREYTPTLFGYVVDPLGSAATAFVAYLPNLVVVVIVAVIAYACTRASRFLFDQIAKGNITWPGFYPEWGLPTHKFVRLLILAGAAVVVFPYLPGSDSPAFRGVSIFFGVLLSLGSSSAVANIVAGTILTYTRAFKIGDRVGIADTVGDVVEKTLLATRVQTIKNELITVPNALVLGSHITNYSSFPANQALILHTTVTIGYDAPWRTVHELLITAARRTSGIIADPAPFVWQTALSDFYVHYEINAYTREPVRMPDIYAELHRNIQDSFNEAGVEIMSPHYSSLRDGNRKAIPNPYLPKDYAAPSFRVAREGGHTAFGG